MLFIRHAQDLKQIYCECVTIRVDRFYFDADFFVGKKICKRKIQYFPLLPIAGLLDLANAYCESQLKRVCERIIKQGITIENTAMLYAAAIKYEAKVRKTFNLLKNLNLTVSLKKKKILKMPSCFCACLKTGYAICRIYNTFVSVLL